MMWKPSTSIRATLFGTAALFASQAWAHAYLKTASPIADATVTAPTQIVLQMSEKLVPQFSGFDVTMGAAPIAMKVKIVKDQMVGTPAKALLAGVYTVKWHAVSSDTHRIEGNYTFTVR